MTASKRAVRRRSCEGKQRFETLGAAWAAARAVNAKKGERLHAYRCPHCRGFHVGHPKRAQTIT